MPQKRGLDWGWTDISPRPTGGNPKVWVDEKRRDERTLRMAARLCGMNAALLRLQQASSRLNSPSAAPGWKSKNAGGVSAGALVRVCG